MSVWWKKSGFKGELKKFDSLIKQHSHILIVWFKKEKKEIQWDTVISDVRLMDMNTFMWQTKSLQQHCISVWCFLVNVREITKQTYTQVQTHRHTGRPRTIHTVHWGKFRGEFLFLMIDFDLLYLMWNTKRKSFTFFLLPPTLTSNKQCPLVKKKKKERFLKYPGPK